MSKGKSSGASTLPRVHPHAPGLERRRNPCLLSWEHSLLAKMWKSQTQSLGDKGLNSETPYAQGPEDVAVSGQILPSLVLILLYQSAAWAGGCEAGESTFSCHWRGAWAPRLALLLTLASCYCAPWEAVMMAQCLGSCPRVEDLDGVLASWLWSPLCLHC